MPLPPPPKTMHIWMLLFAIFQQIFYGKHFFSFFWAYLEIIYDENYFTFLPSTQVNYFPLVKGERATKVLDLQLSLFLGPTNSFTLTLYWGRHVTTMFITFDMVKNQFSIFINTHEKWDTCKMKNYLKSTAYIDYYNQPIKRK